MGKPNTPIPKPRSTERNGHKMPRKKQNDASRPVASSGKPRRDSSAQMYWKRGNSKGIDHGAPKVGVS